ncbi:MAG: metallophosphoesterase [Mangrovibacterium sp.]
MYKRLSIVISLFVAGLLSLNAQLVTSRSGNSARMTSYHAWNSAVTDYQLLADAIGQSATDVTVAGETGRFHESFRGEEARKKVPVEAIFRTKPFLQNPTDNGITISWFTNVPVESWVEYGTNEQMNQKKAAYIDGQMVCNNEHHMIRLTNLQPGKTYSYRICSREITLYEGYKKEFGETAYSDVYTFTIPAPGETDFTALIFNDLHKNTVTMGKFGELLKKTGIAYDFVVFNGDCIANPTDENDAVGFLSCMNENAGAEKVPVFYIRGNHEIRDAYSIRLHEIFDYVGGKAYGAFNWGDNRIVILDCGEDKPDTTQVYYGMNDFEGFRKDQAVFLKDELKGEAFKQASGRILIHHIPIYHERIKYNPCLELWGDILAKAPFDISINAHVHRYAFYPKGVNGNNFPFVTGGGSRLDDGRMLVLQRKGKEMTLRVLDTEGNERDFQVIKK